MNPWPFVIAAYALAVGGTLALIAVSVVRMHRAEAAADALKRR